MKEDSKDILALYDTEEEYIRLMSDFLKEHRELPWEVHAYTSAEALLKEEKHTRLTILAVAESAYEESLQTLQPLRMVILNESGVLRWGQIQNINKYQQAETVLKDLLEVYLEVAGDELPHLAGKSSTRLIGMYSPVRRCFQTTIALTMAQMLAQEKRTLYLNFEHYAGMTGLLPDQQTRDLADLLYFLNVEQDRFRLRMQTIIRKKGSLDYVPPMRSGQNLLTVTAGEWMHLLRRIEELGEYEYVILDLTESMQGLFDILRSCHRVFTLTREDPAAESKIMQYEQLLSFYEYEDVIEKTCKASPPMICRLPDEMEQYTRGDLAEFVKGQLKNLENGDRISGFSIGREERKRGCGDSFGICKIKERIGE